MRKLHYDQQEYSGTAFLLCVYVKSTLYLHMHILHLSTVSNFEKNPKVFSTKSSVNLLYAKSTYTCTIVLRFDVGNDTNCHSVCTYLLTYTRIRNEEFAKKLYYGRTMSIKYNQNRKILYIVFISVRAYWTSIWTTLLLISVSKHAFGHTGWGIHKGILTQVEAFILWWVRVTT